MAEPALKDGSCRCAEGERETPLPAIARLGLGEHEARTLGDLVRRFLLQRHLPEDGKRLGRQPGQRPKSDRLAPKVLALVAQGRSYRLVGHKLGLTKNTVADIVKRNRPVPDGTPMS